MIVWDRESIVSDRERMKNPPDFMLFPRESIVSPRERIISGRERIDFEQSSSSLGRALIVSGRESMLWTTVLIVGNAAPVSYVTVVTAGRT